MLRKVFILCAFVGCQAAQAQDGMGWGVSRSEMREVLLNSDMAQFWQLLEQRAPGDIDLIIEGLFSRENEVQTLEEARQVLSTELARYRINLAIYAPALTDEQRKTLIRGVLEGARTLSDQPR